MPCCQALYTWKGQHVQASIQSVQGECSLYAGLDHACLEMLEEPSPPPSPSFQVSLRVEGLTCFLRFAQSTLGACYMSVCIISKEQCAAQIRSVHISCVCPWLWGEERSSPRLYAYTSSQAHAGCLLSIPTMAQQTSLTAIEPPTCNLCLTSSTQEFGFISTQTVLQDNVVMLHVSSAKSHAGYMGAV